MMCFGLKDRERVETNHCVIKLLDDTQLVHKLHVSSTGQDLLDVVIKHLNLLETSYFGLKYLDPIDSTLQRHHQRQQQQQQVNWLDLNKSAIKQLRRVRPMTVYFGVKYYASDPCKLAEEITRYQFFLQCKQDILQSRLPISFELAIELFGLAVQSELGDYDPERHRDGYVSEFQFSPNQSIELERRVELFHRNLAGQVPATAEMNFLNRVKWLDLYGCQTFTIQYDDERNEDYSLGLNPSGVLVLRNKLKVAHYHWTRIVKTKCQGRCFLMDVINNNNQTRGRENEENQNRFGFRLVDKKSARKLRWAIEEHKSFHQLVSSSAPLNQLAQRRAQQQQIKLSQKFRNSIRSAISVPFGNIEQQQQQRRQQQQQQSEISDQERKLRSSIKMVATNQTNLVPQQQYLALDSSTRRPPTFVRVPSRRFSNRSLVKGSIESNDNSVRPETHGTAHTMVESQRQQALMMMNQFNQVNGQFSVPGKSHTLKPMSTSIRQLSDSNEANRNPYYQMMMMMMMANQQNQQKQPDVVILPPGRHIVQPNVYKTTSMVNNINRLENNEQNGAVSNQFGNPMLQLFNSKPQLPAARRTATRGDESPRSTKSAIAPSAALRLASKKLAKKQQPQLVYANHSDLQPLLAREGSKNQYQVTKTAPDDRYYGIPASYQMSNGPNPSPRSIQNVRAPNSRLRSKSINENLHLLNDANYLAKDVESFNHVDKMLFATSKSMAQGQPQSLPPPPVYASDSNQRHFENQTSLMHTKRRATFAINGQNQTNLMLNLTNNLSQRSLLKEKHVVRQSDEDDDYYCSRSDCSSVDDGNISNNKNRQPRAISGTKPTRGARQEQQTLSSAQEYALRAHSLNSAAPRYPFDEHQDWNAIRKRHDDFSSGKSYLSKPAFAEQPQGLNSAGQAIGFQQKSYMMLDLGHENNNNSTPSSTNNSQLIKNIANKQATPILLSMNDYDEDANSKAVHLLNMRRRQLNSSVQLPSDKKSLSSSVHSSLASSPQDPVAHQRPAIKQPNKTSASSSTTSGFYAGSNSIGSASADSDNGHAPTESQGQVDAKENDAQVTRGNFNLNLRNWQEAGSYAV